MNVQSLSRKSIYKVSFLLLLIGLMLSSVGWVSTAGAQNLVVGVSTTGPALRLNLPFKIHAPWRAGVTLRAAGDYGGNFYGDGDHIGADRYAIDFNGPNFSDSGQTVVAVADGVIYVGDYGTCLEDPEYHCEGYGNTIVLEHGFGIRTRYAHLDQTYIARYAPTYRVNQGDPLGTIGMTGGTSTGDHLHLVAYQFPIISGDKPSNFKFSDKAYPIRLEPMEDFIPLTENLDIRSNNYRVGYVANWSTQIPAITKIYEKYGGRFHVFGLTKTPVLVWGGSVGGPAFQEFYSQDIQGFPWSNLGDSGIMTSYDMLSAYFICAPIWDEYIVAQEGPFGSLGSPTQGCIDWQQNGRRGYRVDFQHGHIIWWADTRSFTIVRPGIIPPVLADGIFQIPSPLVYPDGSNPPPPSVDPSYGDDITVTPPTPVVPDGIEVCDGTNYGAPCKTYTYTSDGTCINLASDGWDNKIESLRFKGA
jgi:murein DD-endopeptidase MepM/ murein hydrolase activator NlpD